MSLPDFISVLVGLLEANDILPTITPKDIANHLNKEQVKNECRSYGNTVYDFRTGKRTLECKSGDANITSQDSYETKE